MTPYRQIDAENWSRLKAMDRSPLYYQHRLANPVAQSPAMLVGSAIHCIGLEGLDVFHSRYVAQPAFGDMRTKKAKEAAAQWELDNPDAGTKIALTAAQFGQCIHVLAAINANDQARELVAAVKPEQHFVWTDSETGILCKGQQDGIGSDCQLSLKTTRAESPEQFGREYFRMLYHGQTAYYLDGYNTATTIDLPEVVVAVQNMAPYDCWVLEIPDAAVDEGRQLYGRLLDRLKRCTESGYWPGAVPTRDALHIPSWAVHDETEIESLGLEM